MIVLAHSLITIDYFANDLRDKDLCQKINKAIIKTNLFINFIFINIKMPSYKFNLAFSNYMILS